MPTYVYRRSDGTTFEIQQRMTEPALATDPETGLPVERVISGAGLVFKGSGFYLTDYARKTGEAAKKDASESGTGDAPAKSEGPPSDKPDAKSEPAPAAKPTPAPTKSGEAKAAD